MVRDRYNNFPAVDRSFGIRFYFELELKQIVKWWLSIFYTKPYKQENISNACNGFR